MEGIPSLHPALELCKSDHRVQACTACVHSAGDGAAQIFPEPVYGLGSTFDLQDWLNPAAVDALELMHNTCMTDIQNVRALSVWSTIGQPLLKHVFVSGFHMAIVIGPGPGARITVHRRGISMSLRLFVQAG
eukprot:5130661-Amphidinium_carterae.2